MYFIIIAPVDQRDLEDVLLDAVYDTVFANVRPPKRVSLQKLGISRPGVFHEAEQLSDDLSELFGIQLFEEPFGLAGKIKGQHIIWYSGALCFLFSPHTRTSPLPALSAPNTRLPVQSGVRIP